MAIKIKGVTVIDDTRGADVASLALGGGTITATAAELNLLDGVTATTTELNYVNGVTSPIQIQLNNLADNDWVTKTSAYTAVDDDKILADTSAAAFTVTLPAAPVSGDEVWFADPGSNWATNILTVDGNGKNVDGAASFTADVNEGHFVTTYIGTAWIVRFTGGTV